MLRSLRHTNIVSLLEVLKKQKRIHLIFEYVQETLLSQLEYNPQGLPLQDVAALMYQLVLAIEYCHSQQVAITLGHSPRHQA